MLAEILTIGDELCRGEIVDTNSTWLAERLWDLDVSPAWMTSCRDIENDIRTAIGLATERADVVVISGGLGATEDDLTVDVLSALVGSEPAIDAEALTRWRARFAAAGRIAGPKTERQLRVPGGARVHRNTVGAAPGFEVEINGVPVACLPGIPREVHSIWEGTLAGSIAAHRDRDGARQHVLRRTHRVFGRGESDISSMLDGLLDGGGGLDTSIHYRVKFPEILIKLVVRSERSADAEARLDELSAELEKRLGWLVYGVDDDSLAAVAGREILAANKTLAVAESCTGGGLGAAITAVSGSSAYFVGGAITYANDAKVNLLGVSPDTLESVGAVSEACALEMARGVREAMGADIGVSITGIAGPGGGTDEKPVGTVWIGVAAKGAANASRFIWPGPREQVRRLAVFRALAAIRRSLSAGTPS